MIFCDGSPSILPIHVCTCAMPVTWQVLVSYLLREDVKEVSEGSFVEHVASRLTAPQFLEITLDCKITLRLKHLEA